MRLAKFKVEKESHGVLLELYCPECDIRMDLLSIRDVNRTHHEDDWQESVILQGKCPKCKHKWKAVIRIN